MPLYQLHGTSVRAAARCVPPALGLFWSPNEELHLTGQRPSWGAPQDEGPLAHRRWAQRITELSLPAQESLGPVRFAPMLGARETCHVRRGGTC